MLDYLTDVTLVVDRSGSMGVCRIDAENGVNHFLQKQVEDPGETLVTLVQFDTEYEFLHTGTPADQVGKYILEPRGMTALLDAVGRAVNETGERLSRMQEADRPGLVVFVIVTDGQENSSHEFTKAQIKEMITHQQSVYNWQFVFLGANQDAFAEGAGMGIDAQHVANYAASKADEAYFRSSAALRRAKLAKASGASPEEVISALKFTLDEREAMQE